jgi:hypothetical protein
VAFGRPTIENLLSDGIYLSVIVGLYGAYGSVMSESSEKKTYMSSDHDPKCPQVRVATTVFLNLTSIPHGVATRYRAVTYHLLASLSCLLIP